MSEDTPPATSFEVLLERRLTRLEERFATAQITITGLRDHVAALDRAQAQGQERFEAAERARTIQATEYERRLSELNHAHARAQEVLNTYVPREAFESRNREHDQWRRTVDGALSINTGQNKGIGLAWGALLGGAGFIIGVTGVVLALLR